MKKLIFFNFLLASCLPKFQEATPLNSFTLDPVFREYYETYGGEKTFGRVISDIKIEGSRKYQYVETGLLFFEFSPSIGTQIKFSPIGKQMDVEEKPVKGLLKLNEGDVLRNGHVIPKVIYEKILSLGGIDVVGEPLTELRKNANHYRYEQYFENLGFYYLLDDISQEVNLLAYGSWKCGVDCLPGIDEYAVIDIKTGIKQPYKKFVDVYGVDFIGYLLDEVSYINDNQFLSEKIFKNTVISEISKNNNEIKLIPLPERIGINPEAPSDLVYLEGYVFIQTDLKGKGFSVPIIFDKYIKDHGGYEISGEPITKFREFGDVFRQCFRFLCLILDPTEEEWQAVYPEALGYIYHRKIEDKIPDYLGGDFSLMIDQEHKVFTNANIFIEIWEENPVISSNLQQKINVLIRDSSYQPMAGINSFVKINPPKTKTKLFALPSTNQEGKAEVLIPSIQSPNGSAILYEVCIEMSNEPLCIEDNFIIWDNP